MSARCEICGAEVDTESPLLYRRAAEPASTVALAGLERCARCRRSGCPRCLLLVEDRADDFFLDVLLCAECLAEAEGAAKLA